MRFRSGARGGWLVSLNDLPASYDVDDLLPAIRGGLTIDGELYAAPFYGESSMVMYRTDLMEKAGLTMPKAPTWDFIAKAAKAMTDKDGEVYGICLRGKAGWGENMAFLTATANSFGAKWFDMDWKPQFDTEPWKKTLTFYLDLMEQATDPPGASSNGFNENLALFQSGKCGMWIDATVAASFVTNPKDSTVARRRRIRPGARQRPRQAGQLALGLEPGHSGRFAEGRTPPRNSSPGRHPSTIWNWSRRRKAGPTYRRGPGNRSTPIPEYAKVPFAQMTLESINSADPTHPAVDQGSLCRRPVRRHSRVPGHRHGRRPAVLGRSRRYRLPPIRP